MWILDETELLQTMVTRDTVFPVRLKFLFILDFVILSAFSLITDDGNINLEAPVTKSYSETKQRVEDTSTTITNITSLLTAANRTDAFSNKEKDLGKPRKSTSLKDGIIRMTNKIRLKKEDILYSNSTLLPLPMVGSNWPNSEDMSYRNISKAKDEEKFRLLTAISPVSSNLILLRTANATEKLQNSTESVRKTPTLAHTGNELGDLISNKHDVVSGLKNISEHSGRNISSRHGKEFISEEALMESRNYNYDPAYSTYNQQPLTGNPTASGEDSYHVQTFATITRDFWPNYQQHDLVTYPTITTVKTPRAHAYPHYPVGPNLNRWRFPFLGYRQSAKLRGTYPKDDGTPYYDYLDDGDASPLESISTNRWSQPGTGPGAGSNLNPIRPELHRYQEGGYEYNPHYDFAHVHEHGGHSESHDTGYKLDFSKIGLLLLLKLVIAKLKALGALQILLLLLLKAKLLLAMMALKFFMVLKALKLVKYLLAPLLLYSLLPLLLLGPLSLLPALLPLLMNLNPPIDEEEPPDLPDVPDTPDTDGGDMGGMRRKKVHKSRGIDQIQRVLRSEDCLRRVACELAAKKQMALVPLIVSWSLDRLAQMVPLPTVKAYAEAYTVGRQRNKTSSWCSAKYKCNHSKKRS